MTRAVVREWHAEEGWGVLGSPETPGGCWTHFSAVRSAGYRQLVPGEVVELRCEPARQDGFDWRATDVARRGTVDVVDPQADAYGPTFSITWDDEPPSGAR